jgi:hypothetical protein
MKYEIEIPDEKIIQIYNKYKCVPVSKFGKNVLLQSKKLIEYSGDNYLAFVDNLSKSKSEVLFNLVQKTLRATYFDYLPISVSGKSKNKISLKEYFINQINRIYSKKVRTYGYVYSCSYIYEKKYNFKTIANFYDQIYELLPIKSKFKIPYIIKIIDAIKLFNKNVPIHDSLDIEFIIDGMKILHGKYFSKNVKMFLIHCYMIVFISSCQFNIDCVLKLNEYCHDTELPKDIVLKKYAKNITYGISPIVVFCKYFMKYFPICYVKKIRFRREVRKITYYFRRFKTLFIKFLSQRYTVIDTVQGKTLCNPKKFFPSYLYYYNLSSQYESSLVDHRLNYFRKDRPVKNTQKLLIYKK